MRRALVSILCLSAAASASAQRSRADRFVDDCNRNRDDNARYCETRELTLPATLALAVDGRQNGGIVVHGWDQAGIRGIAMVQAQSESDSRARDIARQISVSTSGAEIRAEGPSMGEHESWAVSYELWVPRHTALSLLARNGGLAVDGVDAKMELETTNGGLSLEDVGGEVRGHTTNGGITASLSGDRWRGTGLDLQTTNGGVRLDLPRGFSADLEAGTVNGGFDIDFPITIQGSLARRPRQISTRLGAGGPPIRAVTTNGGVSIRQR